MDTLVTSLARRIARFWRAAPPAPPAAPGGPTLLPAYAALARFRFGAVELPLRVRMLVSQLAAERSACQWCIEHGRHQWRAAQLPSDLLHALDDFATSPLFTEAERAALVFADALTRYADADGGMPVEPLGAVRCHFKEADVAALTEIVAALHFYNPITGALGADAAPPRPDPWHIPTPSAARNLWL